MGYLLIFCLLLHVNNGLIRFIKKRLMYKYLKVIIIICLL